MISSGPTVGISSLFPRLAPVEDEQISFLSSSALLNLLEQHRHVTTSSFGFTFRVASGYFEKSQFMQEETQ